MLPFEGRSTYLCIPKVSSIFAHHSLSWFFLKPGIVSLNLLHTNIGRDHVQGGSFFGSECAVDV